MKEDIILLFRYVREFFARKKLIALVMLIFLVFAFIKFFTEPDEYLAKTSFITQVSSDSGASSGLKNIADLIGVNLGGKKEQKDLPVYLYPKLMNSLSYKRSLSQAELRYRKSDSLINLEDYYSTYYKPGIGSKIRKYTIGLPRLIIKKLSGNDTESQGRVLFDSLTYVSKQEASLYERLSKDIIFGVDDIDGSISISVKMLDPELAAQVCTVATDLLQDEIIDYRLGKAKERYDFINQEYLVKKDSYSKSQIALASYIDRNRFNNTESSQVRRRKLENEANLAYAIYSELESQRILQQLNLNENTPVFTTIQPAIVPLKPVNESFISLMIKYLSIGFIAAVFVHVFVLIRVEFKKLWRVEDENVYNDDEQEY